MRTARASVVLAALVGGAMVASGCGSGAETDGGGDIPPASDVRFTREDGSSARFPETVRAWCGPFDDQSLDVEAVHVLAGNLPLMEPADAFWMSRAVRADAERDPTTTLPNGFQVDEPAGAELFALDDAEHRNNELSSADEEAAGTIRVELTGCEPGDTVSLTFEEVTLGSEYFEAPSISVEGTVVAEIGTPP